MEKRLKTRVQHKIDTYENWELATSFSPLKGEIVVYTPDPKDPDDTRPVKIKVGDGTTLVGDLDFIETAAAGGAGGGGVATPQIQSDWLQENSSKKDYIKNKPFYSLPPKHNFDLGLNRTFEEYVWDGDIKNRRNFSIESQGIKMSWYKVSDTFYSYEDILNGYAYISAISEDILEEMGVQSYLIPVPLTEDVLNNMLFYTDSHYLIGMGAVSTDTPGILPLPDGEGGTIEFDIPEPGTYYMYDETGDMFGEAGAYIKQIVGPADVLSDPNFMIAPDIYGTGTYLAFKKVSELFFTRDSLLDTFFTVNMISYNPSDALDGMCVQSKVSKEVLDKTYTMTSSTDNSYALVTEIFPIFASFETDSGEINGMTPGKGTYLLYSDIGSADGGTVIYLDNFNTGEIIYQIDPKYVPKQKTFVPDYNENDPESKSYIANRPYYECSQYNYYNINNINDTSLRVGEMTIEIEGTEAKIFYQWGYELDSDFKNPSIYNKGDSDIRCTKAEMRITNNYVSLVEDLSLTTSYNDKVAIVYQYNNGTYKPIAYIVFENDVTDKVLIWGEGWSNKPVTFPKKGIYYLCMELENNIQYVQRLVDLKRYRNILPSGDTTDQIIQGSSVPVSSGGVYNALQNIQAETTINADSTKPVSGGAVYQALAELRENVGDASNADTVDGYHIRVSTEPPVEGEVDDYTITFII